MRPACDSTPTHPRPLHPVLHQMAARSFNHAAGDRIALRQVFVVTHASHVLRQVIASLRRLFQLLATQVSLARHPTHSRNHARRLALQNPQQTGADKPLDRRFIRPNNARPANHT